MKTKLRFKLIAILIAVALSGLLIFQGYWLKGLYDSLYKQMETNVMEAMKIADFKELFFRMQEIKDREGMNEYKQTIPFGTDREEDKEESETESEEHPVTNDISISLTDTDLRNNVDSAIFEVMNVIGGMEQIILQGIHNKIDTVIRIRFNEFDSLLVHELKARNIDTDFQLNLVYQASEKHTILQTLSKNHPGKDSDSTAAALDWKNAIYFDYPIILHSKDEMYTENKDGSGENLMNNPLTYRLYIKSPVKVVLYQMLGILLSSLLVLVLVVITFVYLLRTIFRQKTEEELKTDFTNNMTHELKTPISVSYAAVDALLNYDDGVTEKQQKYLSIVKDQLTHLTGLVEQILTLSVENRSTFRLRAEVIDLNEIVLSLIEQYKVKAGEAIRFETDIPDGSEITADRTHLYNMLNNLIDNALKYSTEKPIVVRISVKITDKETVISVSDNGPGISMAHQARIFDRFYRIPSGNLHNVKGHGLGLYYVKDMMAKHDGVISLDSTVGSGSTFSLHFRNRDGKKL